MDTYYIFFIIISCILFIPELLKRFNIPGITSVMLAGIVIGPYGLNIVQMDQSLEVFSMFGAVFLMFLAGMEIDNETLKEQFKNSLFISLLSIIFPFIGGYFVGQYFGLSFVGCLLYGTIFASHSVGIIYSLMNELNLTKTKFGTTLLSATIVVDLITLIGLSAIIKMSNNGSNSEIFLFMIMVFMYIGILLIGIPTISKKIFKNLEKYHMTKIHYVFFIILISILVGELLGLHPVIGAFITGIAVSESLSKEEHDKLLNDNLNAIGYGFFIPIFFLTLGMTTDIGVLTNLGNIGLVVITIVVATILKICSGYISLRILKYDPLKSICGGLFTVPKISASLVAASVGLSMGIINKEFFVAIVILSIVSSMMAPIFIKNMVIKHKKIFERD